MAQSVAEELTAKLNALEARLKSAAIPAPRTPATRGGVSAAAAPSNAKRGAATAVSNNARPVRPAPAPAAAAPTPAQDKLTLSKRELTADSAEARLAVEREIQEKTQQLAALKQNLESLKALSATAAEASASNESPALGQPGVPLAAAASTPRSLLDKLSQTPSLWLWVVAVLAAMLALVAVARRRNKGNGEIK